MSYMSTHNYLFRLPFLLWVRILLRPCPPDCSPRFPWLFLRWSCVPFRCSSCCVRPCFCLVSFFVRLQLVTLERQQHFPAMSRFHDSLSLRWSCNNSRTTKRMHNTAHIRAMHESKTKSKPIISSSYAPSSIFDVGVLMLLLLPFVFKAKANISVTMICKLITKDSQSSCRLRNGASFNTSSIYMRVSHCAMNS